MYPLPGFVSKISSPEIRLDPTYFILDLDQVKLIHFFLFWFWSSRGDTIFFVLDSDQLNLIKTQKEKIGSTLLDPNTESKYSIDTISYESKGQNIRSTSVYLGSQKKYCIKFSRSNDPNPKFIGKIFRVLTQYYWRVSHDSWPFPCTDFQVTAIINHQLAKCIIKRYFWNWPKLKFINNIIRTGKGNKLW